ncbi:hypothetical protein C8J56DRAFT_341064 [Mycena floridula]|nr:hypothetical protein C8J56DRAFT_341064 [Mycena floridula]
MPRQGFDSVALVAPPPYFIFLSRMRFFSAFATLIAAAVVNASLDAPTVPSRLMRRVDRSYTRTHKFGPNMSATQMANEVVRGQTRDENFDRARIVPNFGGLDQSRRHRPSQPTRVHRQSHQGDTTVYRVRRP